MMQNLRRAAVILIAASASFRPASLDEQAASTGTTRRVPARLKLITWNIEYGKAGLDSIADFLQAQDADLIFLQEVSRPGSTRGSGEDQARLIAERIGELHIASGVTLKVPEIQDCDLAILSKFPIRSPRALAVVPGDRVYAIQGTVGDGSDALHILNVHTHATFKASPAHVWESSRKRIDQVAQIIDQIERLRDEVIVAGDFNAPSLTPEYSAMLGRCVDFAAGIDGNHRTFPARQPMLRLDYVFGGGRSRATSYRVVETELSDHRPVVVLVESRP